MGDAKLQISPKSNSHLSQPDGLLEAGRSAPQGIASTHANQIIGRIGNPPSLKAHADMLHRAPASDPPLLLQLQRLYGNSYVGQVVQRAQQDHPGDMEALAGSEAQQQEERAPKPNNTGLPDGLKSGIESLSGVSLDNVKVHYNSAQPAQLSALAYAQGSEIHIAPGQERHLPHEAWHIVQQAQGRVQPTMQMKDGVSVNDDAGLEHEADVMGAKAAAAPRVLGQEATPDPNPRLPADRAQAAGGSTVQRVVVLTAHDYGNGMREPEIRTSPDFDTNHLVQGDVTYDEAVRRLNGREGVARNTVVSENALRREVGNNDLDLVRNIQADAVTQYPFQSPAEAMQASNGGAIYAATVGVKARRLPNNVVEIHHLHEADIAIHAADFPALGSAPPEEKKK
jgi:hypothetical protein